jgi:hypothetical protein
MIRMTDAHTCLAGRMVETDREFQPSTDVLISKADLLHKIQLIKDLTVRMRELQSEQAYKTQKSDLMHAQEVKKLQEGYCPAIKELKERNEVRMMRCEKVLQG